VQYPGSGVCSSVVFRRHRNPALPALGDYLRYVFITGRREMELSAASQKIGHNVTSVQGDVSKLRDLDHLFEQIQREKGRIDIVFANPAIAKNARLEKITAEFYDSIFNINAKSVLLTVQKALPLLPDGASIILTKSIADPIPTKVEGSYPKISIHC